jgi:hypothetical protein
MSKYKEIFDENQVLQCIERDNGDGSFTYIPIDEGNSDYQRYLNPEAEQSTPNLTSE